MRARRRLPVRCRRGRAVVCSCKSERLVQCWGRVAVRRLSPSERQVLAAVQHCVLS